MINNKRLKLKEEYFDRSEETIVFRLFQYSGFFRYDTRNGRFVKNSKGSFLRSILLNILLTVCCSTLTYNTLYSEIMTTNEVTTILVLAVYFNIMFLNINFFNRNSLTKLFEICMEIDEFIGIPETKFMRDTAFRMFRFHIVGIAFMAIITSLVLSASSYYYVELYIIIAAFSLVIILHGAHIYISFFIMSYLFISMRVTYLNKALLKKYKGNKSSVFKKKTLLFDGVIWKEHFDDLVNLNIEQFRQAFSIIFRLLRQIEICYRFLLLSGAWLVTVALFLGIQFLINYIKYDEPKNKLRLSMSTLWIPFSWGVKLFIGLIIDIFLNQITTSKQICMDMMLEPNLEEVYRQTAESIYRLLEVNDPQLSVYGLYICNLDRVVKSTTGLIVFIIIQFQYSFPSIHDTRKKIRDFDISNSSSYNY